MFDLIKKVQEVQNKRNNKIEKKQSDRKTFIEKVTIRASGKSIGNYSETIEMARRIVQLFLFMYRHPLKAPTIKGILYKCFQNKIKIYELSKYLRDNELKQDEFILFCYWYLKKYGNMKLHPSFNWIL